MNKKTGKNNFGFTLVEVIAVLVLLSILAAMAIPKFINLEYVGNIKLTQVGFAEAKSSLYAAYGRAYLKRGSQPTINDVIDEAGLKMGSDNTFGDVVLLLEQHKDTVKMTGLSVKGKTYGSESPPQDKWTMPSNT